MEIQNSGQFLRNKLLLNVTHMKSTDNKDCTFSEKLYPELLIRCGFLLKCFNIRFSFYLKTCHHFKLKDTEVYLEDILGLNLINFVSPDLKLHD